MRNVSDVVRENMCSGCGLCVAKPSDMNIDEAGYLRPTKQILDSISNDNCPGLQVEVFNKNAPYDTVWGPILSCESGYSTSTHVRHTGSSGGVITALVLFLLEEKLVDEAITTGSAVDSPIRNQTIISGAVPTVIHNAGSRYAPSAPLALIRSLLGNGKKYVFVGKPCDVAGLRSLIDKDKRLEAQFPYLLSFMCAGVPSELGTLKVLEKMNIDPKSLSKFKYRGDGWPGLTTAVTRAGETGTMTYNDSWGTILNKHLQVRCKICADGTGESADVVCADAWHESKDGYPSFEEGLGRSLIIARTDAGSALVSRAKNSNSLSTERFSVSDIAGIQPYQANRKKTALARGLALTLLGAKPTKYRRMRIFRAAQLATPLANLKAFAGAFKRRISGRL